MEKKLHEVALDTLGSGAAVELFGVELAKALANIADVNTAAEAKREITLTVTIKPSKDRSFGTVAISGANGSNDGRSIENWASM